MFARASKKNNIYLIKFLSLMKLLPVLQIEIQDLNEVVEFSWHKGLRKLEESHHDSDRLILSSESLHFIFAFDFGVDTLNVNARFNGSLVAKKKLIRCFSPLALNNTGRFISIFGVIAIVMEPSFIKQGLRTVGLWR